MLYLFIVSSFKVVQWKGQAQGQIPFHSHWILYVHLLWDHSLHFQGQKLLYLNIGPQFTSIPCVPDPSSHFTLENRFLIMQMIILMILVMMMRWEIHVLSRADQWEAWRIRKSIENSLTIERIEALWYNEITNGKWSLLTSNWQMWPSFVKKWQWPRYRCSW